MKCLACGYVSFDDLPRCKQCGAGLPRRATGPVSPPPLADMPGELFEDLRGLLLDAEPQPEEIPVRERPLVLESPIFPVPGSDRNRARIEELADEVEVHEEIPIPAGRKAGIETETEFRIDDDLIPTAIPERENKETARKPEPVIPAPRGPVDRPEPAFAFETYAPSETTDSAPIIDRDEEVPEKFWAQENAGLGRRSAALLIDQVLLAVLTGLFLAGAGIALRVSGFDPERFLTLRGLQAAGLPFALLALLLSLSYFVFFHGWSGRTPGKGLVGIEVRTLDGGALSWGRALARWFAGLLALVCAGAGFAWAIFEPRRRSWADLLSGTIIGNRHDVAPRDEETPNPGTS